MHEIKFRGKRIDNGEWVYGYYIKNEHRGVVRHFIVTDWAQVYVNSFEVDPETVGQFTGLYDKNGKEIYERDLIQTTSAGKGTVVFSNAHGQWFLIFSDKNNAPLWWASCDSREVVGNIYEQEVS